MDATSIVRWEAGDLFPTKRHVDRLLELAKAGPAAIPRRGRSAKAPIGLDLLADPRLWSVVRKLLAHPDLMAQVEKLADAFTDPTSSG